MFDSTVGTFRQQVIVGNLDISDYVLGGQITRSLSKPTGTWTLYLRPILNGNQLQALPLGLNDFVEIRLDRKNRTRQPGDTSTDIRVAMRGFLDNEDLQEHPSASPDGSPQRQYMLSGSDIGKMLERRQIFIPKGSNYMDVIQGLDKYKEWLDMAAFISIEAGNNSIKPDSAWKPLSAWVGFFLSLIYKNELEQMLNISRGLSKNSSGNFQSTADQDVFKFNYIYDLPKLYSGPNAAEKIWVPIQPMIDNTNTTSFWEFIQLYCTKPFIETYITEDNNNTNFHLRWSPMRMRAKTPGSSDPNAFDYFYPRQFWDPSGTPDGQLPWFSEQVNVQTINSKEVMVKNIRRQEMDRCTYFMTRLSTIPDTSAGTGSVPVSGQLQQNARGSNPYYDKGGIPQFGIRAMTVEVPWYPMRVSKITPATSTATGPADNPYSVSLMLDIGKSLQDFNTWLVDTMTFTDACYSGYITILGNSDIQLGDELYIEDLGELYYIESVEHTWSVFPNPSFLTRIGVTRGSMRPEFFADVNKFAVAGAVQQTQDAQGNTTNTVQYNRVTMGTVFAGRPTRPTS